MVIKTIDTTYQQLNILIDTDALVVCKVVNRYSKDECPNPYKVGSKFKIEGRTRALSNEPRHMNVFVLHFLISDPDIKLGEFRFGMSEAQYNLSMEFEHTLIEKDIWYNGWDAGDTTPEATSLWEEFQTKFLELENMI